MTSCSKRGWSSHHIIRATAVIVKSGSVFLGEDLRDKRWKKGGGGLKGRVQSSVQERIYSYIEYSANHLVQRIVLT